MYDLAGKKITTLLNNVESQGLHTLSWNAKDYGIAAGTYLIRMPTANKQ